MRAPNGEEIVIDEYRRISRERPAEHVERIVMDRPEMRNAQDPRMLAELDDAFEDADHDDEVRCIILAGRGPDFSSGHDLSDDMADELGQAWKDQHSASIGEQMEAEREFFYDHAMRLRDLDTPTIASVQGNCVLAGLMLADVCDLIVAGEDAKFVNPSLRHAGTAAEVLTLPWSIGVRKTKELLWTGDPLYAEEAKELGLVNRVVPTDELREETLYLARRISLMPPETLQMTKTSLNNILDQMGQEDALEYHFLLHQISHRTKGKQEWEEAAAERREEGGFGAWLEFRDGPFRELAAEYDKDDPHVP
jgi:enoyl-CoA hydratase